MATEKSLFERAKCAHTHGSSRAAAAVARGKLITGTRAAVASADLMLRRRASGEARTSAARKL